MEKEKYLTHENSVSKVELWEKECRVIKSHRPFNFDPKSAALLVLDMQNVFLDADSHGFIPASPAILQPIHNLVKKFSHLGRPVIFTRHINDLDDDNRIMRKWWRNPIPENDEKSFIFQEFETEVSKASKVVLKHYYSAFVETKLEKYLKNLGISQIVITGVMTHLCCETTIRDGFMHNLEPFLVIDGTASYTEILHLGALRAIAHGFGIPISSQELLNLMETT